MKNRSKAHGARIGLESLESRTTPAKILDPSNRVYQDRDGDNVLVRLTKPATHLLFNADDRRSKILASCQRHACDESSPPLAGRDL